MVHIQTFGYIPSLLFYLGRYFFSALVLNPLLLFFQCKNWQEDKDTYDGHYQTTNGTGS